MQCACVAAMHCTNRHGAAEDDRWSLYESTNDVAAATCRAEAAVTTLGGGDA